ncbi:hypothetical protein Srubr_05300 [Streptomyces rubradiris]|uniref:Uncharacterized protein n=1 Tax=Streptomyces rubradiris TaxID=285531 RepID=A0ABQ3R4D5_STRRR|nr:hypothetical protein GCM10018792_24370 [Streptomyces rubradiris]GHI50684.1 hypothetical protein Srubr_05300 [Streptomyces rubradiris]
MTKHSQLSIPLTDRSTTCPAPADPVQHLLTRQRGPSTEAEVRAYPHGRQPGLCNRNEGTWYRGAVRAPAPLSRRRRRLRGLTPAGTSGSAWPPVFSANGGPRRVSAV